MALSSVDLAPLQIPSPQSLADALPLKQEEALFIERSRGAIDKILRGEDKRLLAIVGPCSIHDVNAAYEYAMRLASLSRKVSGRIFIVMRTYFEKARTADGWKGLLYDPHLDSSNDMGYGLTLTREFLTSLAALKLPAASEILGLTTFPYFVDLLSWGCIGARTASSQPHREIASSFAFPVGFKNGVDGNLHPAVYGILSARKPHSFMGIDREGRLAQIVSEGNPACHLVLRGGEKKPNYDAGSIDGALRLLDSAGLSHSLIVDCSHGNCQKDPLRQAEVFENVCEQRLENGRIAGLMVESFLEHGHDSLGNSARGLSITDPCLGWEMTERLLEKAVEKIEKIS